MQREKITEIINSNLEMNQIKKKRNAKLNGKVIHNSINTHLFIILAVSVFNMMKVLASPICPQPFSLAQPPPTPVSDPFPPPASPRLIHSYSNQNRVRNKKKKKHIKHLIEVKWKSDKVSVWGAIQLSYLFDFFSDSRGVNVF